MRPQRAASLCVLLSVAGLGLAGFLAVLHFGFLRGELLGGAVCGGALNCHVVAGSSWGTVLGVPLSFWGLFGYVLVLALALLAGQGSEWSQPALTLIAGLALGFLAVDVFLLAVMVGGLRTLCLLCLATYATNLLVFLTAWRALPAPRAQALSQFGRALGSLRPTPARTAPVLFWCVVATGAAGIFGTHLTALFISRGTLGSMRPQLEQFVHGRPRVPVDTSGDPLRGPAQAEVRLVEFSDFMCPACQRASQFNAILLAAHKEAALVFKNFPLDTSCNAAIQRNVHPGACRLAEAGECAARQGKFWEFHDMVFHAKDGYSPSNLEADAAQLGLEMARFRQCLASGEGREAVLRDVLEGQKAGVVSTPTFVIDGVVLPTVLTPATFDDLIAVIRERR